MRFMKTLIKKLYHLIWFLGLFLLFTPSVYAEPSISNFSVNSSYIQPNSFITGTPSANKLRFDVQSDGSITYIRNIFCFDSRVTSWYTNLPTTQLYDVIFYDTNQTCKYYGSNYTGGHVMYFYATYEPVYNPSVSLEITFDTSFTFSIGLINYNVSHSPYQYIFSQPDESTQVNIDTNGIINSQNQSSQNIINNQDSNTQDIINNQDSNTQDIINNQDSNTQEQIESQKVCNVYDKTSIIDNNKALQNNGSIITNNTFGITNYININQAKVTRKVPATENNNAYMCFYNINKELISCETNMNQPIGEINIPIDSSYIRFTINKNSNKPQFEVCKNGNQALDDSLNNIDNTLNDSSIDSSDNTINNLKNQIPTNSVISDLLLLPVRFLQNFVNALGSSCSTFSLGSLYGTELFMPCINLQNYLGTAIWTTIDLIISGMFVYALRKKFIEIYENLTNLKNGGNEVD